MTETADQLSQPVRWLADRLASRGRDRKFLSTGPVIHQICPKRGAHYVRNKRLG